MEYRNRGFGTRLLERSLHTLRNAGLARGVGIAKENSPVAKFLYPKFGGTAAPYESTPLLTSVDA
jgi:ribosomal protein S18 acetylase RimI-like enzyme